MIVSGNPTSSLFIVIKRKLVELIKFARPRSKRIDEERRDSFIKRLADILTRRRGKDGAPRSPESVRVPSKGRGGVQTNDLQARSCWSLHAEANASPSTPVGGYPARRVTLTTKRLFRNPDKDNREAVDLFSASVNTVNSGSALAPATIEDYLSKLGDVDMLPPKPAAHLDRLPDICPHGGYDPRQCDLCVNATRSKAEMEAWTRRVNRDPAYMRAKEHGLLDVPDIEVVRAKATQIAQAEVKATGIRPGLEYAQKVAARINQLIAEWKARGDAVLWP